MKIIEVSQGSPEWIEVRRGLATSSRASDVIAKRKKGEPSAMRANYAAQLIRERLTGRVEPHYVSAEMQWGTDHQDDAARLYEFMREAEVNPVGFVLHEDIEWFGASPDGLVVDRHRELGLVEIKCPLPATHLKSLRFGEIDSTYIAQMQAQMAVTGLPWCDFVSYDPRWPEAMQLWVKRIVRDDAFVRDLEAALRRFLDEVADVVAELERRFPALAKEVA